MIPNTLRITLTVAVICYFLLILRYLKNKMLELKYTLIWLFAGFIMGLLIVFPELLVAFIRLLGIESNMNNPFILLSIPNNLINATNNSGKTINKPIINPANSQI